MTRKPYDRLPPATMGDTHAANIYVKVGEALAAWEELEERLAMLFAVLTFARDQKSFDAITRAYGTIATFRGRKEMLMAAAEVFFGHIKQKALFRPTVDLIKDAGDLSARRNEIAHGTARTMKITDPTPSKVDDTIYWMPPFYNSNKNKSMSDLTIRRGHEADDMKKLMARIEREGFGKFKYNSQQIATYTTQFRHMLERAQTLRNKILALRKPLPHTPA